MIYNKITIEEFEKISCLTDEECLDILKKEYNDTFKKALVELSAHSKDMDMINGYEPNSYSDEEILQIFSEDTVIEFINDVYYCENDKDIVTNYYVVDSVGTDKGSYDMIVESGYVIGEC